MVFDHKQAMAREKRLPEPSVGLLAPGWYCERSQVAQQEDYIGLGPKPAQGPAPLWPPPRVV